MLYKQMLLAPVSYKDSSLKVLFAFQVWARLFVEVCISLFSYFCTYLYERVPCRTDDIKHFQQGEPENYFDYTNW